MRILDLFAGISLLGEKKQADEGKCSGYGLRVLRRMLSRIGIDDMLMNEICVIKRERIQRKIQIKLQAIRSGAIRACMHMRHECSIPSDSFLPDIFVHGDASYK